MCLLCAMHALARPCLPCTTLTLGGSPVCVVSHATRQFSDTSWVSEDSTLDSTRHDPVYLEIASAPTGEGRGPPDCLPSTRTPVSSPGCSFYF